MWRYKMIYKKDANFPYPLLTNTSDSYEGCNFSLSVNLEENIHNYRFYIEHEIDSNFITDLLETNKAKLVLIIQSKDNKFYELSRTDKYIEISKTRISLSKRTTIQLLIQSKDNISFNNNNDLNSFYNSFKDGITIPSNSILGFSNTVIFDGSISKPLELFEKRVDPNINSDVKVELGLDTIIINYKNEDLQFTDSPISSKLNNPYVYMGLQKALYRFITNHSSSGDEVYLDEIDVPEGSLDFKLYNLMTRKMISELNVDNIDEVIYLISDRILERYTTALRGQLQNGN